MSSPFRSMGSHSPPPSVFATPKTHHSGGARGSRRRSGSVSSPMALSATCDSAAHVFRKLGIHSASASPPRPSSDDDEEEDDGFRMPSAQELGFIVHGEHNLRILKRMLREKHRASIKATSHSQGPATVVDAACSQWKQSSFEGPDSGYSTPSTRSPFSSPSTASPLPYSPSRRFIPKPQISQQQQMISPSWEFKPFNPLPDVFSSMSFYSPDSLFRTVE